jgi:uncharacterized protein (DUF1800 family)
MRLSSKLEGYSEGSNPRAHAAARPAAPWLLALTLALGVSSANAQDLAFAEAPASYAPCTGPWIHPSCPGYRLVVEHVLARVGFGADRPTRWQIYRRGLRDYLREQLYPQAVADPEFDLQLEPYVFGPYSIWGKSIPTLESQFCNMGGALCTDRISNIRHANANLAEVKFLRAAYSDRQLEAVLLDFWLNHFNADGAQRIARWAEQDYEQASLGPHVLGYFEDLLLGMTKGIAMLDYLDLRRNLSGNTNENFARELLELHTVGKIGTFDEEDVQQVALVLTGWTYNSDREFVYRPGRHDDSVKVVTLENTEPWVFDGTLGCEGLPASEFENEGHVLLCLLARHPRTAERLSRKLVQRFVAEEPPDALVKRVAAAWLRTKGNLRRVVATILFSPEFLSLEYERAKVKRPYVYTASLVRAVGAGSEGYSELVDQAYSTARERASFHGIMGELESMGERLYLAPPPTGYPEISAAWASAGGLLARMNLADRIVREIRDPAAYWRIPAGAAGLEIVTRLGVALAPGALTPRTRWAIAKYIDAGLPPETPLDERVRQAARVLLASPEFMLH